MQYGRAVSGAIKPCSGLLFGACLVALLLRVVFGNRPLLVGKDVDPKALASVQMGVSARFPVHADQDQNRVELHRGESVRGHAVHFATIVHGDKGHTGSEASHGLPERFLTNAHMRVALLV